MNLIYSYQFEDNKINLYEGEYDFEFKVFSYILELEIFNHNTLTINNEIDDKVIDKILEIIENYKDNLLDSKSNENNTQSPYEYEKFFLSGKKYTISATYYYSELDDFMLDTKPRATIISDPFFDCMCGSSSPLIGKICQNRSEYDKINKEVLNELKKDIIYLCRDNSIFKEKIYDKLFKN